MVDGGYRDLTEHAGQLAAGELWALRFTV